MEIEEVYEELKGYAMFHGADGQDAVHDVWLYLKAKKGSVNSVGQWKSLVNRSIRNRIFAALHQQKMAELWGPLAEYQYDVIPDWSDIEEKIAEREATFRARHKPYDKEFKLRMVRLYNELIAENPSPYRIRDFYRANFPNITTKGASRVLRDWRAGKGLG